MSDEPAPDNGEALRARLGRTVLLVAGLNFAYFFVEFIVARVIGSVALYADSVDFLEDTAVNVLVFLALGWPLARRALVGKLMAVVILLPAAAAITEAVSKISDPTAPRVVPLVAAASGAIVINLISAILLKRIRHDGGSLTSAAFLAARNDVLINVAIIVMAFVTLAVGTGWPDIVLGLGITALALHSAYEVWEISEEERLDAKALAGEDLD